MEVEFDQTPEDLVALRRWYLLRMPERRWRRWWNRIGAFWPTVLVLGVLAYILWVGHDAVAAWDIKSAGMLVAIFGAILLFSLILPALGLWGQTELKTREDVLRQIRKGRVDQAFLGQKWVVCDEEWFNISGGDFEISLAWSRIPNVVVDTDHLFVFTTYTVTHVEAFIVPRWAFGRDDQFLAFCEQAISCWQAAGDAEAKS